MSRLDRLAEALLDEADGAATAAHDPCSHLANAQRLVEHYGEQMLYVEGIGWHIYGPPWRHDELAIQRLAQGLGKIIADEAAAMAPWVAAAPDKATREHRQKDMDRRFKWAGQSESQPTIEFSLAMARPLLAEQAAAMDADPDLLGLPSGVLDLRTMNHRRYRHSDRITKVAGCDFDLRASAPTWRRVIDEAMGGDAELIDFLQRLAGYTLSGRRGEHLLPVFWGSGANGKSTVLGALQAVMGGYASSAAPGLLIQRHGDHHPTALADLQGRRLVVVSETGETGRLNEEQVKLLTGGDLITARRMRQDFYTFAPSHLLVLQTNHRPRVSGTDEGIWRRLRLVPFNVTVPPGRRDPRLPEKLRAELPGILNWCLDGWRRYLEHGFNEPAAVRVATSEYRTASDQVGLFLDECCVVDNLVTETAANLYRCYAQWAQDAGERPRSQRDFGMRLSERGFERVRTGAGIRWRGLRISVGSEPCVPDSRLIPRKNIFREDNTQNSSQGSLHTSKDDEKSDGGHKVDDAEVARLLKLAGVEQ